MHFNDQKPMKLGMIVLLSVMQLVVYAQNKTLGVGTATPNPNAVLHLESPTNNQGLIIPRMTTAQRTNPAFTSALSSTDAGLLVFDTDKMGVYVWEGSQWGDESVSATITTATGSAGYFESANPANGTAVVTVIHKGNVGGAALYSEHQGSGNGFAAILRNAGATNAFPALIAETVGTGGAGEFKVLNAASTAPSVYSTTNGTGVAVHAQTTNTATTNAAIWGSSNSSSTYAANFRNTNTSSTGGAIYLVTYGTGSTTVINHRGSSGNIAEFQDQDSRVARIDKTGKGFFNGGTQTGGADIAEMFDVEGERNEYEPGDVLIVSESTDRTVEKSNAPNSTKVAGVYATKPGVLLTEKSIEDNLDALVPMGVVGVIPTKVCLENGPIKRGDLLVTSSTKGHAMKAVPVILNGIKIYPTGAILGKALENFESGDTGLINVLVNVK
jgi:hypothetical protein